MARLSTWRTAARSGLGVEPDATGRSFERGCRYIATKLRESETAARSQELREISLQLGSNLLFGERITVARRDSGHLSVTVSVARDGTGDGHERAEAS